MNTSVLDFCLLIPCYNNFNGLIRSLESVTYFSGNYVVLIVDDGSNEPLSLERIKNELKEAKPLVVLRNEKNSGITAALNKGLAWISENTNTKYIARLDCSDICHPERFIIQVQYMNDHPGVGLTGSWCQIIDKEISFSYSYKTSVQHDDICKEMYYRNVFMHATVMFRASLLKKSGYYPTNFEYAEDYAFFWMLIKVSQSFVLDKFLVICELNKGGLSYSNKGKQLKARWKVVRAFGKNKLMQSFAFIRLLLLYILPKELLLHLKKWKG